MLHKLRRELVVCSQHDTFTNIGDTIYHLLSIVYLLYQRKCYLLKSKGSLHSEEQAKLREGVKKSIEYRLKNEQIAEVF